LMSAIIVVFCAFSVSATDNENAERPPTLSAQAYVLFCADNGEILAGNNADTPMGMASTTKIMTSLLALEYAEHDDKVVKFTSEMTAEGSSMYLKAGDKVRLSDLASGMMTVSGNDAALAAAIAISGDAESFSDLMNKRASKIGMKNTCFKNPSGLSEEGHFSTPFDMALLMAEAMENDAFRELTSKKTVTVDFINPPDHRVTYNNHNRLLSRYEFCIGGKTGYTKASGRCLVTCSEKDNLRLIAVTFNAPSDWQDHTKLYDYGFANKAAVVAGDTEDIYTVNVMGSVKESVSASVTETHKYVADKSVIGKVKTEIYVIPFAFAPLKKGDVVGKIVCTLEGKVLIENNIVAQDDAPYLNISAFMRFIRRLL